MEITVKKQVEETVQVETPAYYKSVSGWYMITDTGHIITVFTCLISFTEPGTNWVYKNEAARVVNEGTPCTREEFQAAYRATLVRIQAAVDGVTEDEKEIETLKA